jgi:hypothetical protein
MSDPARTVAIRTLNDKFRENLSLGVAIITPGVAALGVEAVERIVRTIAAFDDFSADCDPPGERDFGAFDAEGQRIFFKIDYYDQTMSMHSPDAADAKATTRTITVMLAHEY